MSDASSANPACAVTPAHGSTPASVQVKTSRFITPGEGSSLGISIVTVVVLIALWFAATNLGWIKAGWQTNIEIDPQTQAIVDTVERVLAARQPA